jgi:hypothetical protein
VKAAYQLHEYRLTQYVQGYPGEEDRQVTLTLDQLQRMAEHHEDRGDYVAASRLLRRILADLERRQTQGRSIQEKSVHIVSRIEDTLDLVVEAVGQKPIKQDRSTDEATEEAPETPPEPEESNDSDEELPDFDVEEGY